MRQTHRRILAVVAMLISWAAISSALVEQARAELEIDFDAGFWIPFLPDYTAGSIAQGGIAQQTDLFRDDQTDLGTQLGLSGYYRPPGAERRIAFDFDLAGIGSMGSTDVFADPTPGAVWFASLDGINHLQTAAAENATFRLDSDVLYNSQYVGLANTRFVHGDSHRPIDWEVGFSHMQFEQEFNLTAEFATQTGQYLEDLDTNYLGGEIRSSVNRRIHGHDLILDFGLGFYNMNADYRGQTSLRAGAAAPFHTDLVRDEIDEFALTVDLALRVDTEFKGVGVRPGVTFKYISDMPVINHPMTEVPNSVPAFISTDSGYFLGVNVEIFLLCRDRCCCR